MVPMPVQEREWTPGPNELLVSMIHNEMVPTPRIVGSKSGVGDIWSARGPILIDD